MVKIKPEKGAEAVVEDGFLFGEELLVKRRIPKEYRENELDILLRKQRTKQEARLLYKAKEAGVVCPVVYQVNDFEFHMSEIKGKMLYKMRSIPDKLIKESAHILVKLHSLDIIHGDFTPANLIETKKGLGVIDFGLGFFSTRLEDKAVDLFTMHQALGKKSDLFFEEYEKAGGKKKIAELAKTIQSRARYMER